MISQLYGNRNILGKCIKGCGWQLAHNVKLRWEFQGFTGPENSALDVNVVDEERARAWASPTRRTQKFKHPPWCLLPPCTSPGPAVGDPPGVVGGPCSPPTCRAAGPVGDILGHGGPLHAQHSRAVGEEAQGWRDARQGQATWERGTGAGGEVTR